VRRCEKLLAREGRQTEESTKYYKEQEGLYGSRIVN